MRPSHQVPGTLPTSFRFPPAAGAQAQAEITPPVWEGSTKSKKPGSRSASGNRSLIPTLGRGKSACSIKFGSASQLRQGAPIAPAPGHSSAVAEACSGRPRGRAPTGSWHSTPRDAGGSQFTPSRRERRPGLQRLCRALQEQRQRLQGRPRPAPTPLASKMLQVFPERKPNPLQDANFCSRLFFW